MLVAIGAGQPRSSGGGGALPQLSQQIRRPQGLSPGHPRRGRGGAKAPTWEPSPPAACCGAASPRPQAADCRCPCDECIQYYSLFVPGCACTGCKVPLTIRLSFVDTGFLISWVVTMKEGF